MATIRDVARAAGVSVATVSRVLNNHARVRTETRSRVTQAARTLDYTPNEVARSLITSRTHAFGVLLPDLYGEFFSEVLRGVDLRAGRRLPPAGVELARRRRRPGRGAALDARAHRGAHRHGPRHRHRRAGPGGGQRTAARAARPRHARRGLRLDLDRQLRRRGGRGA